MQPRLQRVLQVFKNIQHNLQVPRQVQLAETPRHLRQTLLLPRRSRNQPRRFTRNLRHQQVPDMPRQLPAEVLQVRALPLQLIDNLQHPRRVALLERRRHLLHRVLREHAQQRPHLSRVQRRPAAGNRLVKRRQRIPHRPLAHLRNHGQSLRLGRNPFLAADPLHPLQQLFKIHAAKRKLLAPRSNSRRNLVRLRRAQDKHHPLGRLLERLQQRVKRFVGDLMRLVDDEDFIAVPRRPVPHALAQLPHLVNAAVGSRVDLDHIHRAARRNLLTARAHPAGVRCRSFDAVQKPCH